MDTAKLVQLTAELQGLEERQQAVLAEISDLFKETKPVKASNSSNPDISSRITRKRIKPGRPNGRYQAVLQMMRDSSPNGVNLNQIRSRLRELHIPDRTDLVRATMTRAVSLGAVMRQKDGTFILKA